MQTAILVPIEGLIVRDPKTKAILAKDGAVKPLFGPEGRYWRRRIKDGSVIIKLPIVSKVETQKKNRIKKEI